MNSATANTRSGAPWVGRSIPRVEDPSLLSGRGRFIDDIGVRPGTLNAAILRSPHAHANIVSIVVVAAKQARGVIAVLTGEDIKVLTGEPRGRGEGASRMLADRGRPRALCRRAGRHHRCRKPLPRRRRNRPDRCAL